jgi:hypothetical protein
METQANPIRRINATKIITTTMRRTARWSLSEVGASGMFVTVTVI